MQFENRTMAERVPPALREEAVTGEVDLDGGFGETSPLHSVQAVAALPCTEDILDPAQHPMDRLSPVSTNGTDLRL